MSIVDIEYAKKAKTPITKVTITRFLEDQVPSVDGEGTDYDVEIISHDMSHGFDQGTATCTIVVNNPYDLQGNMVRFEPMDRVRIYQGWNIGATLRVTFFGFVDRVELVSPHNEQRLECRDMLKLAQDNYLIHSNRKVYYEDPVPDELDGEGNPMGGQPPEERTAKAIISTFLTESGVGTHRQILDFVDYPDEGAIIIGNNAVAVFEYESALDAINRICDLIGYRIWADPVGCVQCRATTQIASDTASIAYRVQEETYNEDGTWTVIASGNLLNVQSTKDDDLRNWVTVYGYGDLSITVAGESNYVPDPPKYRRTEIRTNLLDTSELLVAVANRIYNDLNRLRYTASLSVEGHPLLKLGIVVSVYDPFTTYNDTVNYILYSYSSTFSAGVWTMNLELTGGVMEEDGSPPVPNIAPIALFDYAVEQETIAGSVIWADVVVDGSSSYDPDGDDISYLWVSAGFSDGTEITNTYHLTGQSSITVTLTVTDNAEPPLSNSMTRVISCEPGASVKWKTVFVGSTDSTVYYTTDGGASWQQRQVF